MQELFPPLPIEVRRALQQFPQILDQVLPQNAARRRLLPLAIEELSTRLTSERGVGALPYWSAPRLTAAYIWYFLPWNIVRLARLLHGLDLPAPAPMPLAPGEEPQPRVMADMGSGPLSLPLALWLAKPQWRQIPLTVLCLDAAPHPLELGQRIFSHLAGPDSPWRIVTARAPLSSLGRELSRTRGVPWLITGANVLNELKGRARGDDQGTSERLEGLAEQLSSLLQAPDARALLVEPGTRLGGKTMQTLRNAAQGFGLAPEAPCLNAEECPLGDSRTWCHFTFDVDGAPQWLHSLSQDANLRKDALSLSFLLLRQTNEDTLDNSDNAHALKGRIISAPFTVPNVLGSARYACTARGLTLLGRAGGLPSGALVALRWPSEGVGSRPVQTDRKSGALIIDHEEQVQDKMPPRAPRSSQSTRAPMKPSATPGERNTRSQERAEKTGQEKPSGGKPVKEKSKKSKAPAKSKKKPEPKFWEK